MFDSNHNMMNDFYGDDKYLATLETKFVETTYEAAHSLYAGKLSDISKGIHMGTFSKKNDPALYVMSEEESFDIDHEWQFKIGEQLYENL